MEAIIEIIKKDGTKTTQRETYDMEKTTSETFSEMLRIRGIPRKALARHLGLSVSAVSLWCEGKTSPGLITIKRIAEFVELPMNTVIDTLYNTLAQ